MGLLSSLGFAAEQNGRSDHASTTLASEAGPAFMSDNSGNPGLGNSHGPKVPNKPREAVLGLEILHDCPNPTVDIVAVHGLGVNATYAWLWQPKNNPTEATGYPLVYFNWLKDLLPQELGTSCRVMAFNYDSSWFRGAPQQRPRYVSDQLLALLRIKREKPKATHRPLIFLGHSFGGNIITSALLSASRSEHGFDRPIAQSTIGIVFFGTPHRGSKLAAWGEWIARASCVAGGHPESRLLESIKINAQDSMDRLSDFTCWVVERKVSVVCCFEKWPTDYGSRIKEWLGVENICHSIPTYSQMVVPETSACIDGSFAVGVDQDHLRINKFYGHDDPSFQVVLSRLKEMIQKAIEAPNDEVFNCLRDLKATDPKDILLDIETQRGNTVFGTCDWVLDDQTFCAWRHSETSQLLRLDALPGMGKTMLSTYLVKVLERTVEDSRLIYFFCDDKIDNRKKPEAVLRSLTWQLLKKNPGLFQHIREDYKGRGEDLFRHLSALRQGFERMLKGDNAREVFIVIDALDECAVETRKGLIDTLKELVIPSATGPCVKILATYRRAVCDIDRQFKDCGSNLTIDAEKTSGDLHRYIDASVEKLITANGDSYYYAKFMEGVKKRLKSQAGGTFLWVSIILAELCGCLMHNMNKVIDSLPTELHLTYAAILGRIPENNRSTAKFILHCMVGARQPLREKEIQAAFRISNNDPLECNLAIYADIFAPCASIIICSDTVNFCHQTVKDFLLDGKVAKDWHLNEYDANLRLLQLCWKTLKNQPRIACGPRDVCAPEDSVLELHNLESNELQALYGRDPFLRYSLSQWEGHAIKSYRAPGIVAIQEAYTPVPGVDLTNASRLRHGWMVLAVGNSQWGVFNWLLQYGAKFEPGDRFSDVTALSVAAEKGQLDMLQKMIEAGALHDLKDRDKSTPLVIAAESNAIEILKYLLELEGAKGNAKEKAIIALWFAARCGHEQLVQYLLGRGADKEVFDDRPAVIEEEVLGRIEGGAVRPLFIAAENGHSEVVRRLLLEKADPNAMTHAGLTPLHEACTVGHLEVVKALVEDIRTLINLIDDENMTALDLANEKGIFDYLTTKKALLNDEILERWHEFHGIDDEILERGHEFHEIDATIELKLKQFNEKYQTNLSPYMGDTQEVQESESERTDSEIDTVTADSGGEDRNLEDFEDFATPLDMHKSTVPLAKLMDEMMDWD